MCKVSMHCRGHRRRAIPQFARCVLGTVAPMHKSVTWHRGELASRERLAGIVEVTNGPVTLSAERVLLGQHGNYVGSSRHRRWRDLLAPALAGRGGRINLRDAKTGPTAGLPECPGTRHP